MRLYVVSSYRSHAAQKASTLLEAGDDGPRLHPEVRRRAGHQRAPDRAGGRPAQSGRAGHVVRQQPRVGRLRAHAQNYGFVLRYPDGLTKVTGIGFEPWHWRYVGVEQAKAIRALGPNMTIDAAHSRLA